MNKLSSTVLCMVLCPLVLTACGLDAAGTAATSATIKKEELRQGQDTLEKARQQIGQSMEQGQERNRQADEAAR